MKQFVWIALMTLWLAASPHSSHALDLQHARAQGLVGEQLNGYVAALHHTPEVQQLVGEVNQRRKEEYQRISKENGQPVDVVAKLAAEQIINSLPGGSQYQSPSGGWARK